MNFDHLASAANSDTPFDRLVDGELNDQEYRQLLASLEDQPDGWRRCAMAFLEAQAWRQELEGLPTEANQDPALAVSPHRPRPWLTTTNRVLAVVACFLIAFGLGLVVRPRLPAGVSRPSGGPTTPVVEDAGLVQDNRFIAESGPPAVDGQQQPLGHVRFVVDRDDAMDAEPLEVPVFEMDHFNLDWLEDESLFFPPELVRQITRQGHQFKRNHHVLPIELQNGRRVMIPFEQVEIVPAGNARSY